jgi:hypothetical protein
MSVKAFFVFDESKRDIFSTELEIIQPALNLSTPNLVEQV